MITGEDAIAKTYRNLSSRTSWAFKKAHMVTMPGSVFFGLAAAAQTFDIRPELSENDIVTHFRRLRPKFDLGPQAIASVLIDRGVLDHMVEQRLDPRLTPLPLLCQRVKPGTRLNPDIRDFAVYVTNSSIVGAQKYESIFTTEYARQFGLV